jgi:hypothetical protein
MFEQVAVDEQTGTITWPGDVDLDPDVIYAALDLGPDKAAVLVIRPGNTVQTSRFPSDSFAKVCHGCAIGHHTNEALIRNERAALQDR